MRRRSVLRGLLAVAALAPEFHLPPVHAADRDEICQTGDLVHTSFSRNQVFFEMYRGRW